jgi:transposase
MARNEEPVRRLVTIPRIGTINATALVAAVGTVEEGRHDRRLNGEIDVLRNVAIVVGGQFGSEGKGETALEIARRTRLLSSSASAERIRAMAFRRGRDMAAWLGLTPRQMTTAAGRACSASASAAIAIFART